MTDKFKKLIDTIAKLRDPNGGCPWDLEQTHMTLRPYLIEESYEFIEAIESNDDQEMCAELGDVLLQVVLHSQIASERKSFSIENVIEKVTDKMIYRHPHVFGDKTANTSGEVLKNWEILKAQERKNNSEITEKSAIAGIPKNLPALIRAQRMGEKAARVGFDWQKIDSVLDKLKEEIDEFKVEANKVQNEIKEPLSTAPKSRASELQDALENELGDILFALCQIGRWFGLNAEDSLRKTITKFEKRFKKMEEISQKPLNETDFETLNSLWEKIKAEK